MSTLEVRSSEIDLMKVLSCLAVIAIHLSAMGVVAPAMGASAYGLAVTINGLAYFAVPSFIFLSGMTLSLRYGKGAVMLGPFLKRRVSGILLPYWGWSFAYFFIYAFAGYYALDPGNILSVAFLGTGEYHLYFVVILFQLYLLYPWLHRLGNRMGYKALLAAAAVLQICFALWAPAFPYMDRVFVPYLIHFCAGMLCAHQRQRIYPWLAARWPVVIMGYGLMAAAYVYSRFDPLPWPFWATQLWHLYSLTAICAMLTGCLAAGRKPLGTKVSTALAILSSATFYVYLGHPLLLAGFFKLWHDAGLRVDGSALLMGYGSVTTLSFVGALLYLRMKHILTKKKAL